MRRSSSLFHPLLLHALSDGPKLPATDATRPPPFGPCAHDNAALSYLDLRYRSMISPFITVFSNLIIK